MTECPEMAVLESSPWTPAVSAHVATCGSCRLVMELIEERSQAAASRERRARCMQFEAQLAARGAGTLDAAVAAKLDEHLEECDDCRAIAQTIAPENDAANDHTTLPAVAPAAYTLGPEVARGGMGRIIAARDLRIGRPVAVKELLGKTPTHAARFEREARVTARLQHPGIVPIYEIGRWENGTPFYSMRMIEGRTLRAAIAESSTLAVRLSLLPAVIAASEAIAFAHASSVIHRDLTPANIIVGAYGETVVIDWGLAKDLSEDGEDEVVGGPYREDPGAIELTIDGSILGTASYMPPEQASGEPVDTRADVYALGAILYHLLAGAPPYRGKNEEVLAQVTAGPPPALALAANMPRDLTSIVDKAMARDPADRYPSARELVDELKRLQTGRLVEAHRYSWRELTRRWLARHRAAVIGVAAALVALVVAGAFGITGIVRERDRADGERSVAIEQRQAADVQRQKAHDVSISLLEEQGRRELLDGHPTRALAFLNEAYQQGLDTPALRLLLGSALRSIEARKQTFACNGETKVFRTNPAGSRVIATCGDIVRVWRVTDGSEVFSLDAKDAQNVRYSNDGRWILTVGSSVGVWDAATGRLVRLLEGHRARVDYGFFAEDDRRIVTVSQDGTARIWDTTNWMQLKLLDFRLPTATGWVAKLSANGRALIIGTYIGVITIWSVETGTLVGSFDHGANIYDVDINPDGSLFTSCGNHGTKIWNVAIKFAVQTINTHRDLVTTCVLSPDGGRLVTGSNIHGDGEVWDVRTGLVVARLPSDSLDLIAKFSPDGKRIAMRSWSRGYGLVALYEAETGSLLWTFDDLQEDAWVSFSADGSLLLTGGGSEVVAWDASGARQRLSFTPPAAEMPLEASADGTRLLTRHPDGGLTLWNTSGRGVPTVAIHFQKPKDPHQVDAHMSRWLSGDGSRLAALAATGEVVVLDTRDGSTIARIPVEGAPTDLGLDLQGRRLLVVQAGRPRIWDVARQTVVLSLDGRAGAAALSDDGNHVLAWVGPGKMEVWNVDGHRIQTQFLMAEGSPSIVGFDHLGDRVAVIEAAANFNVGRIGLWDALTGARLVSIPGNSAAFDSTSRWLTTFGAGRVKVWSTNDGVERSSALVGRDGSFDDVQPSVSADGAFIVSIHFDGAADVSSAVDGRLLERLGSYHVIASPLSDGTVFGYGLAPHWVPGQNAIVSVSGSLEVWDLAVEHRDARELDRVVKRSPWRVMDGRLVPADHGFAGRVTLGAAPGSGATIMAKASAGWAPSYEATSSSDGVYELRNLPVGSYSVTATDPRTGARSKPHSVNITVGGQAIKLDLELE